MQADWWFAGCGAEECVYHAGRFFFICEKEALGLFLILLEPLTYLVFFSHSLPQPSSSSSHFVVSCPKWPIHINNIIFRFQNSFQILLITTNTMISDILSF